MAKQTGPVIVFDPSGDEQDEGGNWKYEIEVEGITVLSRSARLRHAIIGRCRDKPQYSDVVVHPDFLDYQFFANWCAKQKGYEFWEDGYFWSLDKDLFGKEQRIYSPDTCVFLPKSINYMISLSPVTEEGKINVEDRVRELARYYKKFLTEKAYKSLINWSL